MPKAVRFSAYFGPEVLKLIEVDERHAMTTWACRARFSVAIGLARGVAIVVPTRRRCDHRLAQQGSAQPGSHEHS